MAFEAQRRLDGWVAVVGPDPGLHNHVCAFPVRVRIQLLGQEIQGLGWEWEIKVPRGGLRSHLKVH